MNRSNLLSIGALLIVGLAAGLIYIRSDRESANTDGSRANGASRVGESGDHSRKKNGPKTSSEEDAIEKFIQGMTKEEREAKPIDMPMGEWAHYVARHRKDVAKNGDVTFFGEVVDQDGNPLPGVLVFACVSSYESSLAKVAQEGEWIRETEIELRTNGQGAFKISGRSGVSLTLSGFKLSGYEVSETSKFGYSFVPEGIRSQFGPPHNPDPGEPVIFVIKKVN